MPIFPHKQRHISVSHCISHVWKSLTCRYLCMYLATNISNKTPQITKNSKKRQKLTSTNELHAWLLSPIRQTTRKNSLFMTHSKYSTLGRALGTWRTGPLSAVVKQYTNKEARSNISDVHIGNRSHQSRRSIVFFLGTVAYLTFQNQ